MPVFIVISIAAIVTGGIVMAFSAKRFSRVAAWVSAYLVLIEGLVQLGLAVAWQILGRPDFSLTLTAFLLYNFGNLGVLLGTMYKSRLKNYSLAVNSGGSLLAAAMILLLSAVRQLHFSWTLAGFIVLVIVILVSIPLGLFMSNRRGPDKVPHKQHA